MTFRAPRLGCCAMCFVALLTAPAVAAQPHLLDAIGAVYGGAVPPIQTAAANISGQIFRPLVILEFGWVMWECVSRAASVDEIVRRLMIFVAYFALGNYVVTNQLDLAQQASAALPTVAAGFFLPGTGRGAALTPGDISERGYDAAAAVSEAEGTNPLINIPLAFDTTLAGLGIQFGFMIVGIEALAAQFGLQLVIAIGTILIGFVGSRWTRPHAGKLVNMLISGGILLIVINCIAGLGIIVSDFLTALATTMGGDDAQAMRIDLETIASVAWGYAFIAISIPALAAWLSASGPVKGASEAVTGAISQAFNGSVKGGAALGAGGASEAASLGTIEAAARTGGA